MDMFVMYPERRDDELKKPDSSRKLGATGATSSGSATNGAPLSVTSILDRELLRASNSTNNSNSERERLRKPLPSSSANASDASTSHQNGVSNSRSGGSSQSRQDKEQKQPAPASLANGNNQSSSNSRKRKAAISSEKSTSSNGNSTSAANNSATPLLNISLKKSSAAVTAAAAAAAAVPSQHGDLKGYGNTNLMTFEKCGAKPNKAGQLVADDGTVLGKNGKPFFLIDNPSNSMFFFRLCLPHVLFAVSPSLLTLFQIVRPCIPGLRTARRALLYWPGNGIFAP